MRRDRVQAGERWTLLVIRAPSVSWEAGPSPSVGLCPKESTVALEGERRLPRAGSGTLAVGSEVTGSAQTDSSVGEKAGPRSHRRARFALMNVECFPEFLMWSSTDSTTHGV